MNRFLALALTLALALSLSVTALAEDTTIEPDPSNNYNPKPSSASTSVEFTVAPAYTITIPQTVSLTRQESNGTVTYEQNATITASAGVRLLNGQKIKVTMSAAGEGENTFTLNTKQGATLPYTVTVGSDTTAITSGGTVATFDTSAAQQTSTLHFAANDPTYAGQYSDTVTFTISIVSQSAATP